jgi:hypothetical protein
MTQTSYEESYAIKMRALCKAEGKKSLMPGEVHKNINSFRIEKILDALSAKNRSGEDLMKIAGLTRPQLHDAIARAEDRIKRPIYRLKRDYKIVAYSLTPFDQISQQGTQKTS